jgi:hypothetical protein
MNYAEIKGVKLSLTALGKQIDRLNDRLEILDSLNVNLVFYISH